MSKPGAIAAEPWKKARAGATKDRDIDAGLTGNYTVVYSSESGENKMLPQVSGRVKRDGM